MVAAATQFQEWVTNEMSEQNPYASPPVIPPSVPSVPEHGIEIDAGDQVRADAIINEAGEVWVMMIMCIPCCLAGVLVLPFYAIRLVQWNQLANRYPELVASNVPPKSFQAKFKAARWKLTTGLVIGGIILVGILMLLF